MENQATYKSAIVNGKILKFAQITLKERMKKQQGDIEGQIAALMQKNETHKEWFDAIVQSKPQFPNGVMTYQDIVEKMGNNAMSLEDFLNEKIKEELERKMAEEINKQVETKIEAEKINIKRDADEQINSIKLNFKAKNDEIDSLKERNRDLSQQFDNQTNAHTAALVAIDEKNLTSQAAKMVEEEQKNLELQHKIKQLQDQLFDKKQLERRIVEAERRIVEVERQFAEADGRITENLLTIKNLNEKINTQTKTEYVRDQKIQQLQTELNTKDEELNIEKTKFIEQSNKTKQEHESQLAQATAEYKATIQQLLNKEDVKTVLNESLEIAKKEYSEDSTSTQREHESQLAAEKAKYQQKMMELTKTIVLLKMNLDLKEQQTINSKSTFVPSTTNVIKLTNSNTEKAINLLKKSTLKGGGRKSRLFIKGGKIHAFEYETDDDAIDITDINIFTNAQMDKFEKNIDILQNEIESLKKELESSKTSASTSITPLCTFVNKMTHGSGASADLNQKLYNELLLTKTHISLNANKFLFEKIANLTNKEIINVLTKANTDLKAANAAATKAANAANAAKAANVSTNVSTNAANAAIIAANAAIIAAGTAKAISAANANVFKSKYGNVMFSEHK